MRKEFFFGGGDLVNQKSLSYIIRTLKKKNLLQLILLLIPNQANLYNNKK